MTAEMTVETTAEVTADEMTDEIADETLEQSVESVEEIVRDRAFMGAAIAAGQVAFAAGDVPVGAVVVIDGEIVARGYNRRQVTGDPTAHAEVEALRAASQRAGNWRVEGTLYVTQEPCPMCAGALVNARIKRLVYGCPNPKAGAVDTLYNIVTDPRLNHRMMVTSGVRGDECAELLRSFFAALRQRRKAPTAAQSLPGEKASEPEGSSVLAGEVEGRET